MDNNSARPNFIDYAKVIMIYAVVLGHYTYALGIDFQPIPVWHLMHIITLFHMPFFFMVSGYLYKERNFTETVAKGWVQLLMPYLLMCAIACVLMTAISLLTGSFAVGSTLRLAIGVLSGNDSPHTMSNWASALWFCYALFMIKVIASQVYSLKLGGVILLIICLVALCVMYLPNKIPFRIDSALIGFIFFSLGFYGKSLIKKVSSFGSASRMLLIFASAVILVLAATQNLDLNIRQGLSINANFFGPYPPLFIVSGLAGTIAVLSLATFFEKYKNSVILQISNGTIVVLGAHWTIYVFVFKWWTQTTNVFAAIAIAFIDLAICYVLILLSARYFPALLGNRKLN